MKNPIIRFCALVSLSLVLFAGSAMAEAEALVCRMGGPDNKITGTAAEELKTHLERFLQMKVTVAEGEAPAPEQGLRFIVGAGPENAPAVEKPGDHAIVIRGNTVWLWGYDEQIGKEKWNPKNSKKGTMQSVYRFLEEFGGIRWLMPGEENTVRKEPSGPLKLPESFSKVYEPRFGWVHIDQYGGPDVGNFYWRHGQRIYPGRTDSFIHHWGHLLGYNRYFAEHPEYYALVKGERKPYPAPNPATGRPSTQGVQICSSNPDVVDIFAKEIIRRYRAGETIIPISPNDGRGFCECEKCRALDRPDLYSAEEIADLPDGRPCLSDRIFTFVNAVARKVKAECPDAKLGLHLYSFYVIPPKSIERLEDNILGDFCLNPADFNDPVYRRETLRRIREWHDKGIKNMTFYWYMDSGWWSQVLHVHTGAIAEFIKHVAALPGFLGGKTETTGGFATNALDLYVFFALMNNPSRDPGEVVDEFCTLAYGPGAPTMKEFYALAEKTFMTRDSKPWQEYAEVARWYDDAFFKQAEKLIATALEQAKGADPTYIQRIELAKDALEHTKNMVEFIQCAAALRDCGIAFYLPHLAENYRSPVTIPPNDPAARDAVIDRIKELREKMLRMAEKYKGTPYFTKQGMLRNETVGGWDKTVDLLTLIRGADGVQIFDKAYPFQTDPNNQGEKEGWFQNQFSDRNWPKLRLTDFWENQGFGDPDPDGYDGMAWYRISLGALPAEYKGHRVELHFGAVDESCWVWVNGKKVGEVLYDAKKDPDGWIAPRSFDITDAVNFDKPNLIAIRVLDTGGKGGLWKSGLLTFRKPSTNETTTEK